MRFKVYGPYNIGVEEGHARWIDKEDTDNFWKKIRRDSRGDEYDLPNACGVYLFAMGGVEGRKKGTAAQTLPWYVGKAEKQTFQKECFNFKNLYYFNSVLTNEYKGRGTPRLFLLARVGEDDKPSPPAKEEQYLGVRFVEEMFIQMSLSANSELLNKSTTKMARETSIRGLLNTKNYPSDSVDDFKSVFGIKNREPAQVVEYEKTAFRYEVSRSYDIPMKNANNLKVRTVDSKRVEEMWNNLEKEKYQSNAACGVYVLGIRYGGNTTPWYVGTAHDRSFGEKCFKSDIEKLKLEIVFNNKGKPVIYFLPRLTEKKGNFELAKPVKNPSGDMDYVKSVLLEYGVQANENILFEDSRTLNAEVLRDLYVEGFVNSKAGKPSKAVSDLKSLLGQLKAPTA